MRKLFRSYSDNEIISGIIKGGTDEDRVISYLLKANENPIYSYVLKNSGNRDAANTILVEGVSELIVNIRTNKFKGQSALSTYLFSICRSLWLRKLTLDRRNVELSDEKLNTLVNESTKHINPDKIRMELNELMNRIGKSCQTVLEMWSVRYSMTEIAEALGFKNAQIAMNKKNRCLTKLKLVVSANPELRERLKNYLS